MAAMRLRHWPVIEAPYTVLQWETMLGEDAREAELAALAALPAGGTTDVEEPTHRAGTLAEGITFAWERHSEGSSLALFVLRDDADAFLAPRRTPGVEAAVRWAGTIPGEVIRAMAIACVESEEDGRALVDRLDISQRELVSCHIGGGARLWSDFRLHDDGFGRLVVAANGLTPRDLSRQVQRVQELGGYRAKALIGLPLAQAQWPRLNDAEGAISALGERVSDPAVTDDDLLDALSVISLDLMAISTATSFRMSATAAYARLVEERLEELDVQPIPGLASLHEFVRRRFLPAIRTCAALTAREREVSLRANQFAALLRTRIDTRIENQNGRLLRSMERSSTMQLRLQQLVEGLSVVALTYYAVGLVGYVLHGIEGVDADHVLAWLTVPLLLAVWAGLRLLKKRLVEKA